LEEPVSQVVEVTIAPNGDVAVEGQGIKGPGCSQYTLAFAEKLGKIKSDEKTAEYYEQEVVCESCRM
jgi:hypothetical protein